MGHTRPELHNDLLRVVSVYRFLIIYDASRRPVQIIRVIHGAMDLEDEFGS
jgi:antitoxin ParD1/3/4/toxin ParE1/3/4